MASERFIGCNGEYGESGIVLFGAPFDGTASYRPGARFGPGAVRSESYSIESYSPYQDKDLEDMKIFDAGDLELCFGNAEKILGQIQNFTKKILSDGKLPAMIGGEHLVTLGAAKAVFEKYPELRIMHFDAHADMRDDYMGEKLSHATVMRRCHELLGDGKIFQFGIRSGERGEFEFSKKHQFINKFDFSELGRVMGERGREPVYFTLDLDVLDPADFPGTGTPEAGGARFGELLAAALAVSKLNLVGFDMVELSPPCDPSGKSVSLTCKLLREILLALSEEGN